MKRKSKFYVLQIGILSCFGAIWWLIIPTMYMECPTTEDLIMNRVDSLSCTVFGIEHSTWLSYGGYIFLIALVFSWLLYYFLVKKKK